MQFIAIWVSDDLAAKARILGTRSRVAEGLGIGSAKRARAVVNHFLTHIGIRGEYTAVDAQMTRPALIFCASSFRAIAYYTVLLTLHLP